MIDDFYAKEVYSLDKAGKDELITKELLELTELHMKRCEPYADILRAMNYSRAKVKHASDIPFFPVRLFKEMDLMSIPKEEIFKIVHSSGTTGQKVSKIFLDRDTAMIQQKVMIKILSEYLGKQRIPIMIIDTPAVIRDRKSFAGRGAAIIGLQVMARSMTYVLNEDMSLNKDALKTFLVKHASGGGGAYLIFGFTFMVYRHFYEALKDSEEKFDLSGGWLMTGGGWKKLISNAVSQEKFHKLMTNTFGIVHFLDHYGMSEQPGSICAECEYGHLHVSIYSDVFTRRAEDFSLCSIGEEGIIQTVSVLPRSYPGHSLLTEDKGIILGEDDCPCGRKGKYIKIIGRIESAELRGCSDTYAAQY